MLKRIGNAAYQTFRSEYVVFRSRESLKLSEKLRKEAESRGATLQDAVAIHESLVAAEKKSEKLNITYADLLLEQYGPQAELTDLVDNWWRPKLPGICFLSLPTIHAALMSIDWSHHDPPLYLVWLATNTVMVTIVLAAQRFERVENYRKFAKKRCALDFLAKKAINSPISQKAAKEERMAGVKNAD